MARHWQQRIKDARIVTWHLTQYTSCKNITKYIDTSLVISVFAGFVSDVILIEHKIHDHPEGPSQSQTTPEEAVPSQVLIIRVPETDPFEEKLDARIGLANPDRNHQVKCEECGRFLKSRKLRKTHVMSYHPMTAYQCPF